MGSKSKNIKKSARKDPNANMAAAANLVFGGGNKIITDERFAQSQKDPRFQDVPRHKTEVAIDSRFSHMFTDKNFSASSARVDKRGRAKQDGDSSQSALNHYYRMEQKKQRHKSDGDDEYESDDAAKSKSGEEDKGESGEDLMDDYASTDTNEEDEAYLEEETTALQLEEEKVPETDRETHRLAIVKLDWDHVQAVDLFVLLSSFVPKTGQIVSVSVYPTEFGLKRMKEEAVRGPVGLFDDDDDDDDDGETKDDDNEKLRAYELDKLKNYVAVVVCDSIATADYLYETCDGIEFERSSNVLDLRFIPDSMDFKHPARDAATEAPADYEGIDFETRALQLTKVDFTWDENEPTRSKKLNKNINVHQESEYFKDEQQLKEFIAASESESDEDENNIDRGRIDAYRTLLQSGDDSNKDEDEEDNGMEMEVTFNPGLEHISKKFLEKKDKKSETVWDVRRKEKKRARENNSMDSDREEAGGFFAGDSDKKGKKQEMLMDKEGEASKAELELLLGDTVGNVKGYNLKRKKGKREGGMDEEKIPSVVDYNDPRFSSLFTRPDYALDPTDPRFKRSAAYVRQVAHKQHKGDLDRKHEQTQALQVDKINSKHQISMLLKCVKMKSKQLLLPSDGNKSSRKGK